jgi:hypothetical protein
MYLFFLCREFTNYVTLDGQLMLKEIQEQHFVELLFMYVLKYSKAINMIQKQMFGG